MNIDQTTLTILRIHFHLKHVKPIKKFYLRSIKMQKFLKMSNLNKFATGI